MRCIEYNGYISNAGYGLDYDPDTQKTIFTIESYDEQQQLLSSRGLDWFRQNVHFTKGSISDGKESNWGSDWVDDGV